MPKLDNEYNELLDAVNTKVKAAALLLKEAEDLLAANNRSLYDLRDADYNEVMQPIWEQIENIGWSTSSLSC